MDELDAYRAAKLLLDSAGAKAKERAWKRADAALAAGDGAGWNAWLKIIKAINAFTVDAPAAGQRTQ